MSRSQSAHSRWDAIDAFRGAAVVAMIAFHFAFDLVHFGWLRADPYNDFRWIASRTAILSSFLLMAGISLALAQANCESALHFWKRIAKVAGAAMLVSVGSWFVFGERFIWFGVLHAIAAISVLSRPLLRLQRWLIVVGVLVFAIGATVHLPVFDQPLLRWIGMATMKPQTEDYVPVLPWMGVLLIGAGLMFGLLSRPQPAARIRQWSTPPALSPLGWLGRHSLLIYLVHQPLIFGAMTLVAMWLRPS